MLLKRSLGFVLLASSLVYADAYTTLLQRYEKQIRAQEKQLGSLRERLQEKEREVVRWKNKADEAKVAYAGSSATLELTRGRMKTVHHQRVMVRTEADAAQTKTTENVLVSRTAQTESQRLARDLYAQELLSAGQSRMTAEDYSTAYLLERLASLSQSAEKLAQQSQEQEIALRTEEMQLQSNEQKHAQEAERLHEAQEAHWQKWQEALRRKTTLEDEIGRMDQSAKALQVMVQELRDHRNQARALQDNSPMQEKLIAPLKGTLPWPAQGQVVQNYGRQYSEDLKQLVVSNGIKIETGQNRTVRVIQDGKVIYASPFRQYGQMVIVQHNKGLTSVYAGLSQTQVKVEQRLTVLDPIGLTGSNGSFYFELRHHEQPINPLAYLAPTASSLSSRRTFR